MRELLFILLPLAAMSWAITMQVVRKPVTPKRLILLPAGFAVLALVSDHEVWHRLRTPTALAFFALGVALAVLLGLGRVATMRVWRTEQGFVSQGGWRTVLMWVVTIGVRVAVALLAARMGAPEGAGEIMMFVAVTIAAQNAVLAARAGLLGAAPARRARSIVGRLHPVAASVHEGG